jgi:magnesium-transporting ATPase (P-type)
MLNVACCTLHFYMLHAACCARFTGTKVIETRYYDKGEVRARATVTRARCNARLLMQRATHTFRGLLQVLALVHRTAFRTAKGKLVRSILFPKPSRFKFYDDSFKFIVGLAIIAVGGFLYSVKRFLYFHMETREIILDACDLVTVVVPPALPTAMVMGTEFALSRLRHAHKIFCTSPPRVNGALHARTHERIDTRVRAHTHAQIRARAHTHTCTRTHAHTHR